MILTETGIHRRASTKKISHILNKPNSQQSHQKLAKWWRRRRRRRWSWWRRQNSKYNKQKWKHTETDDDRRHISKRTRDKHTQTDSNKVSKSCVCLCMSLSIWLMCLSHLHKFVCWMWICVAEWKRWQRPTDTKLTVDICKANEKLLMLKNYGRSTAKNRIKCRSAQRHRQQQQQRREFANMQSACE